MEKLCPKGVGAYHIEIAGKNHFFTNFDKRVKFDLSEPLTLAIVIKKIDEIIDAINLLETKLK